MEFPPSPCHPWTLVNSTYVLDTGLNLERIVSMTRDSASRVLPHPRKYTGTFPVLEWENPLVVITK